ncbi:hypothetical protein V6N12_069144 [Hibiscus sabdariffa]|uniref:Integrase catalytic domain-containing protein n=1 Tax=Hibiscus sabdariffa TaxID=183260 RepID=A0ABR2FD19_9ROSI
MDQELQKIANNLEAKHNSELLVKPDELLYFKNRMCVPNDKDLRKEMLDEAHQSSFSIHPGSKVKVEHQAPTALLQPLKFRQWKWERITMDFVSGLLITPRKNDFVWVIVDRLTKFAHFIPVRVNMSSDIMTEIYIREVIRLHGVPISIVSDRERELSPRYISPFEVLEKVGPVAYRLALPPKFGKIHNVFHVSMLRRYRSDPSHVLEPEEVELNPDLSYEEEPVMILDREVKRLRNKNVSLVKVL